MARPRQVQAATLQGLAGLNETRDPGGRGTPGGRVYALLRRAIVNIDLVPGTALNEIDVAESLGVSRTPVREAFRKLMADGLVEIQPQKGTFISRLRRSALQDALFVREALECAAVEKAAMAPEADRRALMRIVNRQREALLHQDVEGNLQADEDFHHAIIALSGHPSAWEVVSHARTQLLRLRRIANAGLRGSEEAMLLHERIASAVIAGDGPGSADLLREHIRQIQGFIDRIAELHDDYVA
jgi:DNA-binding GntR family transcriptional regulator